MGKARPGCSCLGGTRQPGVTLGHICLRDTLQGGDYLQVVALSSHSPFQDPQLGVRTALSWGLKGEGRKQSGLPAPAARGEPGAHPAPACCGRSATCAWRLLGAGGCCVAPSEQASSVGGGAPPAGPPEGAPSSRFVRGPFFVDCILICWGLEFIGELLVVWRSCGSQKQG